MSYITKQHSITLQQGLSLIELMIAMALGLVITAGILQIVLSGSQTNARLQNTATLTENGRYASAQLHDEIQLAGYYGLLDELPTPPTALPNPCDKTLFASALGLPVQGYDHDVATTPSSVIAGCGGTVLPNTDVLVTRRVSTFLSQASDATRPADPADSYYLQATNIGYQFGTYTTATAAKTGLTLTKKDGVALEDIRIYRQFIYYVNTNNELIQLELVGDTLTPVVLAEGVENFQVEYGIDSDKNGAVANDDYVVLPSSATEWGNVVSLKTYLLLRTPEAGYTDTKTYNLGLDGSVTPGGNFKRRLFQSSNRIINVSMKREGA